MIARIPSGYSEVVSFEIPNVLHRAKQRCRARGGGCGRKPQGTEISVNDTGPGLPPGKADQISNVISKFVPLHEK
jgi:hypothetical protein